MAEHARDIMTPEAECIGENESLFEAARRMARLNIGSLPICGDDQRLHGLITDRDIVVKVVAERLDPGKISAGDLAQGKPVTIGADAELDEIIDTMEQRKVRRLPVIDEDHKLVGIVSQTDVAKAADGGASAHLVRALSWAE